MMNGLLEAAPAAAPTLADVAAGEQALKGRQTSAVSEIRHHLYAADPRFIAVGLLGFGGTGFRTGERHPNASWWR